MYEIMTADEAIRLIRDGDCICVNSFVGIENPIELHEAIYRRYQKMQSPTHLTMISSAGFGVWDDEHNAEGYIREGAVDKLICGHFGAMLSTKKLVLEDRFEAYNLPLGCISHAIRAQAGGLPGALSKVGLDIFVDPRKEGPGINRISIDDSLVKHVEVDGEEFLYYKLPKINIALIKGTAADRKGNITFDDMFMSGDALSICQAVKANRGKVIVQVDRLVDTPSRPRNAIIPGCLVDAIVVVEPETRNEAYTALTGSFEIPYEEWNTWSERLDLVSVKQSKNNTVANIIGKRASKELRVDDIVNIGIGIPEMVSRFARKSGMLDMVTLTVESGGIGGFPVSGEAFGAMIGAASVYDMANQFDLYDNGGLDVCFMGALEVDKEGNVNAHRGPGAFAGIGGFANITSKTPTVVFCFSFTAKGLEVSQTKGIVTVEKEGTIPKFVDQVKSISFSAGRAIANGQKVLYVTERCVFRLTPKGLKLIEVYPGIDVQKDILYLLPFEVEV
ncbi:MULTISPECIES: CoA-transferase [Clostridia]|uniref:CoA-transferase n=1 Tax=Clostridia TaxID=186801 RepID=UPI000E4F1790|nr:MULTISPECIES: CoA-transferase [Clostridia]RGH41880.1 propionate CoA-transferase [Firmicutes bacterium AM41-5BH]RKQ31840.1 propionate CoA-transferase [Ruminococcus sp. B05]TAP36080.1 propionate CoA-transferase [Mediterraneibacter sp. gm002]